MRRVHRRVCTAVLAVGGAVLLGAQPMVAPGPADEPASYAVSARDGEVLRYTLSKNDGRGRGPSRKEQVDEDMAQQPAPPPPACPSPSETPTETQTEPATAETPDPCPPPPSGDESTTTPDGGTTTPPDGGTTTPDDDTTTPPDGGTTTPDDDTTTPPDGGTTTPDGGTATPDGGTTTPPDDNGPVDGAPVQSDSRFSPAPPAPPSAGPARPAPLVPMVTRTVVMGASRGNPVPRPLGSSTLLASVAASPGGAPSYQPSLALDTFLPELPAVAADRNQAMTADAPRMLALGGQVDDGRLSLWLVASVAFLILLAVCVGSLMDFSGRARDYLDRRFNQ